MRFVYLVIVLTLPALQGCATNPVTGDQDFVLMSESEEISLGQKYHEQIIQEMPVYQDPELAAYVDEVGQRVARVSHRPGLSFHFTLLDDPTVNAFALPGGYVYITRGILAYLNSEAELAAVLGHEVGHVTARHSVRQQSASTATGIAGAVFSATTGVPGSQDAFNVFGKALLSGYGRSHELESDRLGAQYLARSGYDPQAMLEVIGVLKDQELFERQRAKAEDREPRAYHGVFASHPDNDRRLQEVISEADHLKTTGTPRTGREQFLTHMEGLPFGPSENDGVIDGTNFYHKPLNIGFRFAKDWSIDNQPDRLLAAAPDRAAIMEVTVVTLNKRIPPRQYLEQYLGDKFQIGSKLAVKGFEAYTATAPIDTSLGKRRARISVVYDGNQAYLFTGITRQTSNQRLFDGVFRDVARSFHKLSAREKKLATGLKLKLIKAGATTNFAALARTSPIPNYPETELRLLNDLYPDAKPKPGQTLKIVR